jgi:NAD(P)-dependent dehydrogenase (short-subunit alcohol dehydrogenase family)
MKNRFEGKTILVTGGNSGMGFATAKRIVQEGGRVVITGRDEKTLQAAERELGANAFAIRADVSDLKALDGLFATIKQKYGKIDGVFANAGIAKFTPLKQVTEAEYDSLFDINVKGLFFTVQKAIPLLNRGSAVVLNASVAASRGSDMMGIYSATKAAVRSLARSFSAAHLADGIRVNVVSPGPIETPIWSRSEGLAGEAVDATKKAIADGNPSKRYGTMEEIAAPVAFLLSEESSYIVGVELTVDGGANQI